MPCGQNCIKPSQSHGQHFCVEGPTWRTSLRSSGQNNSGLCGSSAWPCTWSPQVHTRAGLNWQSDYGSTVLALAVALSSKTPVLTDWDKWDEIINKTLPLLLSINTMDKKAVLQTIFPGSSMSPQKNMVLCGQSMWALQPTGTSAPAQSFGISAETCCTWLSSEEWCGRRFSGPLSMLDRTWDQRWHFFGPALRNMDYGKPVDTFQQEAFAAFIREQIYNLSVCESTQFIKLQLHSDKHSSPT